MTTHQTVKPKPMGAGHADDFQTPASALDSLFPCLPSPTKPNGRPRIVWECACGQGVLAQALADHGYGVVATDITDGADFLTTEPLSLPWDLIVTNPPYRLKDAFLERAYALGKPFAFLMRDSVFDSRLRRSLFARHGVEIILPDGRMQFTTPSGKVGGSWFYMFWVTWGLEIGRAITVAEVAEGARQ